MLFGKGQHVIRISGYTALHLDYNGKCAVPQVRMGACDMTNYFTACACTQDKNALS